MNFIKKVFSNMLGVKKTRKELREMLLKCQKTKQELDENIEKSNTLISKHDSVIDRFNRELAEIRGLGLDAKSMDLFNEQLIKLETRLKYFEYDYKKINKLYNNIKTKRSNK